MTTISINENLSFSKTHFESLEDFEVYVVSLRQNEELSHTHKQILDERLAERESNPDNYISIEELKAYIVRDNRENSGYGN